jgi:hypothetical protein
MIGCFGFNYVRLFYSLFCASDLGVGHHGGRGMAVAAMVHCVLLIDMCLVFDLYVGMVLTYRRSTLLLDIWSSPIF